MKWPNTERIYRDLARAGLVALICGGSRGCGAEVAGAEERKSLDGRAPYHNGGRPVTAATSVRTRVVFGLAWPEDAPSRAVP